MARTRASAHGAERHRDEDHIGALHGPGRIGIETVDDTQVNRALQMRRIAAAADDLVHLTGSPQGAGQRTADQADTDDTKPPDHAESTFASASRQR
jgi:hypothetical protein